MPPALTPVSTTKNGELVTLFYVFASSTDDATKRRQAEATLNAFAMQATGLSSVPSWVVGTSPVIAQIVALVDGSNTRKAVVDFALRPGGFSIAYKPWASANILQRADTVRLAHSGAWGDMVARYFRPAAEEALNAAKDAGNRLAGWGDSLSKLLANLDKWVPMLIIAVVLYFVIKLGRELK